MDSFDNTVLRFYNNRIKCRDYPIGSRSTDRMLYFVSASPHDIKKIYQGEDIVQMN